MGIQRHHGGRGVGDPGKMGGRIERAAWRLLNFARFIVISPVSCWMNELLQ